MKKLETSIRGLYVIEPSVYGDQRGWFMEAYNNEKANEIGLNNSFVQDNHSFSSAKGTLRGLHYQLNDKAQAKLIRCSKGAIFDVAVDIRKNSPTFSEWYGIELNEDNKNQLFVPKGFAHGFLTLSDNVEVQYKVDEFYSPAHDRNVIWNDPKINIDWPISINPILSKKDKEAPLLRDAEINFKLENSL